MKIVGIVCFLMIFLANSVFAVAPLNQNSIKQAQLYGSSQAKTELLSFLRPWLSYEENAPQLNESVETAYLYTPFLLIAMDAREKKLHNLPIRPEDGEKIITDYLNTLSFSVKLSGATAAFSKDTVGMIRQNNKIINACSAAIPQQAEQSTIKGKTGYETQAYFYFDEKEMDVTKPVTLIIMTGDKKFHSFYFELTQIK